VLILHLVQLVQQLELVLVFHLQTLLQQLFGSALVVQLLLLVQRLLFLVLLHSSLFGVILGRLLVALLVLHT
jgi:hypothetical protein